LRDLLVSLGITRVGMEATGVYWKPVLYLLEEELDCWLLNARHMRNVPGRKTDVGDAQWICQLTEHGLVRASFIPPPQIREIRELTRYRRSVVEERSREAHRLDKVLQDAGIKLSSVASDILGASGRSMLMALVSGTEDPAVLADLAKGLLRKKLPQLRSALEGRFGPTHAILVAEIIGQLDYSDEAISRLSDAIDERIAPFADARDRLCTIPGVDRRIAEAIIGEIGVDMTKFATWGHLASWAGMCPGQHESAGKSKKGTYLASQYHRLAVRRGKMRARKAVGHTILVAVWHILSDPDTNLRRSRARVVRPSQHTRAAGSSQALRTTSSGLHGDPQRRREHHHCLASGLNPGSFRPRSSRSPHSARSSDR
jgi:transposase